MWPLRLVVYDRTDTRPVLPWLRSRVATSANPDGTSSGSPGLSPAWWAGTWLHRLAGAADAALGATRWDEALAWAVRVAKERGRPIGSLQAWGHGGWGFMLLGATSLSMGSLAPEHELGTLVDDLRDVLAGPDALVWLRCCSAFGSKAGVSFARAMSRRLGCRVAGHTYIIGLLQSGTHSVRPGGEPAWGPTEGVVLDAAGNALRAKWSGPFEPATISCLRFGLPDDAACA
jgi:hypothetical protein